VNTGIVYYTKTGNCQYVAEKIKEQTRGDLIVLKEKNPGGFVKNGFRAFTDKTSELVGTPWEDVAEYDTLYLITPIWASKITPAMHAFLKKSVFTDKNVYSVTVQANKDLKNADRVIRQIENEVEKHRGHHVHCISIYADSPDKLEGRELLDRQLSDINFSN
jgi:menaquinone-dependent protoporphyrinogen IX oxidase